MCPALPIPANVLIPHPRDPRALPRTATRTASVATALHDAVMLAATRGSTHCDSERRKKMTWGTCFMAQCHVEAALVLPVRSSAIVLSLCMLPRDLHLLVPLVRYLRVCTSSYAAWPSRSVLCLAAPLFPAQLLVTYARAHACGPLSLGSFKAADASLHPPLLQI